MKHNPADVQALIRYYLNEYSKIQPCSSDLSLFIRQDGWEIEDIEIRRALLAMRLAGTIGEDDEGGIYSTEPKSRSDFFSNVLDED